MGNVYVGNSTIATCIRTQKGRWENAIELRNRVLNASQELSRLGLAEEPLGNVSARDPVTGLIGVTPTGIPYDLLEMEGGITIINQRGKSYPGKSPTLV